MSDYYVKPESELTLEIVSCNAATKEALERQSAIEGVTLAVYLSDAVLARLETDEDAMWYARERAATRSELAKREKASAS